MSTHTNKSGTVSGLIPPGKIRFIIASLCAAAALLILSAVFADDDAVGDIEASAEVFSELDGEQQRITAIIERMEGVSDVTVMAVGAESIGGVAVVCRGGGEAEVQERIIALISALYGLPSTRISVSEGG